MAEWYTRAFEGRMGFPCGFESHRPHPLAGTVSSMAEHRVYIAGVIGSNPIPSTKLFLNAITSLSSSVVEHFSEKEGVMGSIPLLGTKLTKMRV